MMFEEHCKKSEELFGETGSEYHKWIDQHAKSHGYPHRHILHTLKGIELGVKEFGEVARKHLEQHIRDDLMLKEKEEAPVF